MWSTDQENELKAASTALIKAGRRVQQALECDGPCVYHNHLCEEAIKLANAAAVLLATAKRIKT